MAGNAVIAEVESDDDLPAVALLKVALWIDEVLCEVFLCDGLAFKWLRQCYLRFELSSRKEDDEDDDEFCCFHGGCI